MMRVFVLRFVVIILFFVSCASSCAKSDNTSLKEDVDPGNDPNFTIVANNDNVLTNCNRKVIVFGVDIYAVAAVSDSKLLHAANVMAQYLDNDEDGKVDNQLVIDKMLENRAFVIMWKRESDLDIEWPAGRMGQDLGNDETIPGFVTSSKTGCFDASLEEIWHIITHAGYSCVYPDIFGENAGTSISVAMDEARGGRFTNIPDNYPTTAWYSYDDSTCEYDCQVTEYFYWSMSSILGAQENRLQEIKHEWKLNTREKVQSSDPAIYNLLTDPKYKFPGCLPDGSYKH